jgi:hypothetical protein
MSQTTRDLLPDARVRDLGEHSLKGITKPERIFQLNEPGLSVRFPPLRAEAPRRGLAADLRSRIRARRAPTLDEAGWSVRGRMVGADDAARAAFSELGADLFVASRADTDAKRFLGRTDSRLLHKRLREHEEIGVLSRNARERAAAIRRQLDMLGEMGECRETLGRAAVAALGVTTASAATNLSGQLRATNARLDDTLSRARTEIGATALHLRRTRHPGIRRAGDLYAVPSIDETGVESVPTFETLREARTYWRAQRLREKTFSSKVERDVVARANLRRDSARARLGDDGAGGAGVDADGF